MKRKLLITALALSLVFTACGKGGNSKKGTANNETQKYEVNINYDAKDPDFTFFEEYMSELDGKIKTSRYSDQPAGDTVEEIVMPKFEDYYFNYASITVSAPRYIIYSVGERTNSLTMDYTTQYGDDVVLQEYLKMLMFSNYIGFVTYVPDTILGDALPVEDILPAAKDMFDSKGYNMGNIYDYEFATKDKEIKIASSKNYTNNWGLEGVVSEGTIENEEKAYNFKAFSFNYADVSYVYLMLPRFQVQLSEYRNPSTTDYELENYTKGFDIVVDTIRPTYYSDVKSVSLLSKDKYFTYGGIDKKNDNAFLGMTNIHFSKNTESILGYINDGDNYVAQYVSLPTRWDDGFYMDARSVRIEDGAAYFDSDDIADLKTIIRNSADTDMHKKISFDDSKENLGIKTSEGKNDNGYNYKKYVWDSGDYHYTCAAIDISEINDKVTTGETFGYFVFIGRAPKVSLAKKWVNEKDDSSYYYKNALYAEQGLDDAMESAIDTFEVVAKSH